MSIKKILFAAPLHYTSTIQLGGHQYAKQFNKNGWEVFYFSNALSFFNICFTKDKREILERLKIYIKGGLSFDKTWCYVPLTLLPHHNNVPVLNNMFFLNNYYKFTMPSIRSMLLKKKADEVEILWMDCCNQSFWMEIIKYKKIIYRIPDNIFAFKQKSRATISDHYKIMDKADLILMPSRLLFNNKEYDNYRGKMMYCPNGVNFSNFDRENYALPEEYKSMANKKIALYVGSIDEWFDFELLAKLGTECRETNFVIIGPIKADIPKKMSANVIFLGKREYMEIPNYIRHCDIGIIPFKNNDLVKYVNPIKMYEYLYLGKPVISTFWEELGELNAPVFLAKNEQEFISYVKDPGTVEKFKKEDLINYASCNSWDARYNLIIEKLGI